MTCGSRTYLLALLIGIIAILSFTSVASAANVLSNPGAESGTTSWNTSGGYPSTPISQDTTTDLAHSGTASFRVDVPGTQTGTDSIVVNNTPDYTLPSASNGKYCTATAWVRSDQNMTVRFRLREWDNTPTLLVPPQPATLVQSPESWTNLTDKNWHLVSVVTLNPVVSTTSPARADTMDLNVIGYHATTGQKLYVDDVSMDCSHMAYWVAKTGSNNNNGSSGSPFLTATKGMGALHSGDTLTVKAGTYNENASTSSFAAGVDGTSTDPILIRASPSSSNVSGNPIDTVTLGGTCAPTPCTPVAQSHGFTDNDKSYLTVTGLQVTGTTGDGVLVSGNTGGSVVTGVTLDNIKVTAIDASCTNVSSFCKGISLAGNLGVTQTSVVNSSVDHANAAGFFAGVTDSNITFNHDTASNATNTANYSLAPGFSCKSSNCTVMNSTAFGNADSGIEFYGASTSQITGGKAINNVLYKNGDHGVDDMNATNTLVLGNTVYSNQTAGINFEGTTGLGSTGGTAENNISMDNGLNPPCTPTCRAKGNLRADVVSAPGTTFDYNNVYITSPSSSTYDYLWGGSGTVVFYANQGAFHNAVTTQEGHGVEADPKFVSTTTNSENFALNDNSAAIDRANSGIGLQLDQGLNARYDDTGILDGGSGTPAYADMGALEKQTNTPVPTGDPMIAIAGDSCSSANTSCTGTGNLIRSLNPTAVVTVGDNAYNQGTATEFANYYAPNWGSFKSKTYPALGNHEYDDPAGGAAGFYSYFGTGSAMGSSLTTPYYSFDIGTWHFIVLDSMSNTTPSNTTTAQYAWLQNDLATHSNTCTAAIWHEPRFNIGMGHQGTTAFNNIWTLMYNAHVDLIFNGHEHMYERYGLMDASGNADTAHGIREFVVGTGGAGHAPGVNSATVPQPEAYDYTTYGVLELTLHSSSYDYEFAPATQSGNGTYTDAKTTENCRS